jgi:formate dehydrogenase subunit gamma
MTDEGQVLELDMPVEAEEEFTRFSLVFRLQHIAMFTSLIILIVTGLPLKYADTGWAMSFFHAIGGVKVSGIIHRIGAAILIAVGTFHVGYIAFCADGRHNFKALLPGLKDFGDVYRNLLYFFGFKDKGARFGRFSYLEKFDYWAVYWGMVVMILSGLILWFHNYAMSILPKAVLDIAREAHSDEALLATLAIVVWHFYNVHFNPHKFPMSWIWLTGKISKEEMIREHPLEYEKITGELLDEPPIDASSLIVPGLVEADAEGATQEEQS